MGEYLSTLHTLYDQSERAVQSNMSSLIFPIEINKKVTFNEKVRVRFYNLSYEERLAKHLYFNYTIINMQKNINELIKDRSLIH